MNNEQIYFDTLRRIAKEYMTTEQLRAENMYGVSYHEALEMSYDNIQGAAADAIRGKRRPKDKPVSSCPLVNCKIVGSHEHKIEGPVSAKPEGGSDEVSSKPS